MAILFTISLIGNLLLAYLEECEEFCTSVTRVTVCQNCDMNLRSSQSFSVKVVNPFPGRPICLKSPPVGRNGILKSELGGYPRENEKNS
jgi:hypothetical protein